MVGFSLSMLMPETVLVPTLSALSVAVRVTDWPAPLLENVMFSSSGQTATPERASEQANLTPTGLTYQPLFPMVPLTTAPLMVGAVLSSLMVTESVPVLPAVSFAEPFTTRPLTVVSLPTTTSGVTLPAATPEPGSVSVASKCTVTLLLFQSAAFAFGFTVWVTVGAMLSYFSTTLLAGSTLPATSVA
jgi:hypothetical protein